MLLGKVVGQARLHSTCLREKWSVDTRQILQYGKYALPWRVSTNIAYMVQKIKTRKPADLEKND